MDKVWAYPLDSGLSGYGGSDTWEAFLLLERITYGETVCICKGFTNEISLHFIYLSGGHLNF